MDTLVLKKQSDFWLSQGLDKPPLHLYPSKEPSFENQAAR
jgi:hypothetical protein